MPFSFASILLAIALPIALIVSLPVAVFAVECTAALLPLRRWKIGYGRRPRIAVLIPAHNEQLAIADTVRSVLTQLLPSDRVIVIADNCTDQTASLAQQAGADTWERHDPERRGKGYAILFALQRLRENPPDIVVSVDADCQPEGGALVLIAQLAAQEGRPVQAAYLMEADDSSRQESIGGISNVSAFAVLVKNYVRPRGLQRLGRPCLLTGSGMAFPWSVLEKVPHPDAHIVEDMSYASDLTIAGFPPIPCMEAVVRSALPTQKAAFLSQRKRWEHGHLATLAAQAPRLLAAFVKAPRASVAALLLETAVPPLSLLIILLGAATTTAVAAAAVSANWIPLAIVGAADVAMTVSLAAVWRRFGQQVLPLAQLLQIPRYMFAKLPLYGGLVTSRERQWIRTERTDPAHVVQGPHQEQGGHLAHDAAATKLRVQKR